MFPFDPLENIRKPLIFSCIQGDQKTFDFLMYSGGSEESIGKKNG